MKRSITTLAALVAVAGFGLGCTTDMGPVEQNWGNSVKANALAQTADPNAGTRVKGPKGLDPVTGEIVAETYKKNQRKDKSDPRKLFLITQ